MPNTKREAACRCVQLFSGWLSDFYGPHGILSGVVFGLFMLLTTAGTALANWEYTRWGMSPNEVARASGGMVVTHVRDAQHSRPSRDDAEGHDALATGTYSAAGFDFVARFLFSTRGKGLTEVTLAVHPLSKCLELLGTLKDIYGPPEDHKDVPAEHGFAGYEITGWRDRKRGNGVLLFRIGPATEATLCDLSYRPLRSRADGL